MALVHPHSAESTETGLDLFDIPPTQTSVVEGNVIEHFPLSTISTGAPIEFFISGADEHYLDLKNSFLHIKAKITKKDGTDLDADTDVAPVNNWIHTLFQQVDVYLNDTLVTGSDNTYPYRAYLTNMLTTSRDVKRGALTTELFYRDSSNHLDDTQGTENGGLANRRELSSRSKVMDMMATLKVDLAEQSKYILPGVSVKIKLIPSKSQFNLIAHDPLQEYQSVITHASYHVRKIKVNPAIALAHEKVLEKTTAKYPMKRIVNKVFSIARGQMSHVQDNLFLNQTPTRLFIILTETSAFNGEYKKNPFNFKSHHLNYLSLTVDGKEVLGKPFQPDFSQRQYVRSFHSLMEALGLVNNVEGGSVLEYRDFNLGYCIFGADLSPSRTDGAEVEFRRASNVRLEMKFSEGLTTPLNVLCMGVMDSIMEIDKSRQVLLDF